MGWRQGKGIGPAAARADGTAGKSKRRWGPEAGVGPDNTPIYALAPKTDTHGLGFDPFKVQRMLPGPTHNVPTCTVLLPHTCSCRLQGRPCML
jgi:hypothetical protein